MEPNERGDINLIRPGAVRPWVLYRAWKLCYRMARGCHNEMSHFYRTRQQWGTLAEQEMRECPDWIRL